MLNSTNKKKLGTKLRKLQELKRKQRHTDHKFRLIEKYTTI